jgi:hypothetical protein
MPKSNRTNITHDAFIKDVLSNRGAAIAFIQSFLPEKIVALLDVESIS